MPGAGCLPHPQPRVAIFLRFRNKLQSARHSVGALLLLGQCQEADVAAPSGGKQPGAHSLEEVRRPTTRPRWHRSPPARSHHDTQASWCRCGGGGLFHLNPPFRSTTFLCI